MTLEGKQAPLDNDKHEGQNEGGEAIENDNGGPVMDEEWFRLSRSIVRKLDLTLMPIIWILYLFNYLDRTSIAYEYPRSCLSYRGTLGLTRASQTSKAE
jgi:hypothetical protein